MKNKRITHAICTLSTKGTPKFEFVLSDCEDAKISDVSVKKIIDFAKFLKIKNA